MGNWIKFWPLPNVGVGAFCLGMGGRRRGTVGRGDRASTAGGNVLGVGVVGTVALSALRSRSTFASSCLRRVLLAVSDAINRVMDASSLTIEAVLSSRALEN